MMPFERPPTLAVCSWSLQPQSIDDLVAKLRATGICHVQLALSPLLEQPARWVDTRRRLDDAGMHLVSGMISCVGEDYSTIQKIQVTGGIMPDDTYPATLDTMRRAAPLAASLGIRLVTFHAGFIPHVPESKGFNKALSRVSEAARVFADAGATVALETGQEPAEALVAFLNALRLPEVGVNFDPANMLLYGSGEVIAAIEQLHSWIRQVHVKDALPSPVPGEWGQEVPAGMGQVDWEQFFERLPPQDVACVIEREAGTERVADVMTARQLVERFTRVSA